MAIDKKERSKEIVASWLSHRDHLQIHPSIHPFLYQPKHKITKHKKGYIKGMRKERDGIGVEMKKSEAHAAPNNRPKNIVTAPTQRQG